MPDVKKLITGFLILAAGASSSALILSSTTAPGIAANTPAQTATAGQTSNLGGNAFANNQDNLNPDSTLTDTTVSTTTEAQLNDPTNLTNNLADVFLNNFVAANPDGGQTDANGNASIAPPDNQAIINQLAQSQIINDIKIPNWDIEAAESAGRLAVSKSDDPNDNAQYVASLKNIFDQNFIQPNLQGMLNSQNPDPAAAEVVSGKIQAALQASMGLQTPAAAVNFQKSLIKMLVYEKNTLALLQNVSADPVKTGFILQAEEQKYNTALEEFQNETKKASALGISFGKKSEGNGLGFINELLGIKTAHAFLGIGDITFDPAVFGQMLINYAKDIALQILKNTIMALLQQKILAWIQGSGAPRFIQNWGSTIVNSYATAATNALNAQFACVPQSMLPSLRILLSTPSIAGGNNACAAQFQSQLGNNLTNFYNHFENGGFDSYFSLFQPGGNAFGALITISDNAAAAGSVSQQATLSKVTSAQGYKGSEVCADGSNPNGTHGVCLDNNDIAYRENSSGGCDPGLFHALESNGGKCANGSEPQVTTPGNVTNQAFGVALDSSSKLITAATSIVGILNAFLSSLLNTLATNAINYSTQAINGALSPTSDGGTTGVPISPVTTPPAASEPPVQCQPSTQFAVLDPVTQQASADFYGQGGASAPNGSLPTYNWSAPGVLSASGGTQTGVPFTAIYNAIGIYTVTVTASTDNTTSNCTVQVQ
jgi:hypothetical protein